MKCPKCRTENPETQRFCGDCGTPLAPSGTPEISVTRTIETGVEEFIRGATFAGRYEIVEELGAGGMGRVYRAFDKKLQEDVALKLIRPDVAADRKTVERFHNEIKIARKITHKNVCRTHDLHEEGKTLFLTMEYVRGEDLRSLIHRTKALTVAASVSVACQVADGLAEAHRLGVVHRDLKPGNIMIDKDGQAKIMDFGIARSLLGKGLTGQGAIVGTPEYMSPEQVEGKETDPRSDLYALGIILYEMLIGRPPFEGETPFSIAAKHKTEPPPVPKKLIPQIPDDLNKLIVRCLEKDKTKRYQTAEDLAADLSAIEQSLPSTDRALTRAKTKVGTSREITVKLTPRKIIIPLALLALVMIIALAGWRLLFHNEPTAAAPKVENSISVISLRNQTGLASLDFLCQRSIPDFLITNLENSGFLRVTTWERMTDVLGQMGKKNAAAISESDGFEVCRREGIKFIVTGSLSKSGETFGTNLMVFDAETKDLIKPLTSMGRGESSILESQIDELSRGICAGLGIGENKLQAKPFRIADVMTSSLEASRYYFQGLDLWWQYKWREALPLFEKAVAADPSFASAYFYMALIFFQFQDLEAYEKAAAQTRRLMDRTTEKERLYIQSFFSFIEGDQERARSVVEELIAKYPKEKSGHYQMARYWQISNDYERAIEEMKIVLNLDPDFADAYNMLALYSDALGQAEQALEYAKEYVAHAPESPNAYDTLALISYNWGRYDEAEENWIKSLEKDPDFYSNAPFYFSPYLSLSQLRALRQDYPAAFDWIKRLFERKLPGNPSGTSLAWKAFLELWMGRFKQSLGDLDLAAAAYKNEGKEYAWFIECLKSVAYGEMGDYTLGRKHAEASGDSNKKISGGKLAIARAEMAYNLAWIDLMQGRVEPARERLKEMAADSGGPYDLIPERETSGEDMKAKLDYLRALLSAELSLREGVIDLSAFEAALKNPPAFSLQETYGTQSFIDLQHLPPPLLRDTLARAYVQRGELDQAIAFYERLVSPDPKGRNKRLVHPLAHYRLAKLYEQTERKNNAVASFEKFLDLWKDADPGRPEVEDARKRLAGLQGR